MTFQTIENDVIDILKHNTDARADDMTLYSAYVWSKVQGKGMGAGWLQHIFSDRRARVMMGIAPYESVSRIRRKVQFHYAELRPTEEVRAEKKALERKYKAYAKGVKS